MNGIRADAMFMGLTLLYILYNVSSKTDMEHLAQRRWPSAYLLAASWGLAIPVLYTQTGLRGGQETQCLTIRNYYWQTLWAFWAVDFRLSIDSVTRWSRLCVLPFCLLSLFCSIDGKLCMIDLAVCRLSLSIILFLIWT